MTRNFHNDKLLSFKEKFEIWIDDNDLEVDLHKEISKGIEEAKAVVIFVSENYSRSDNCRHGMISFMYLFGLQPMCLVKYVVFVINR